jgi:hypothetical protein
VDWEFIRWIWNNRATHDRQHIERLSAWLCREIERGRCVTSADGLRRVWWVGKRTEQAIREIFNSTSDPRSLAKARNH